MEERQHLACKCSLFPTASSVIASAFLVPSGCVPSSCVAFFLPSVVALALPLPHAHPPWKELQFHPKLKLLREVQTKGANLAAGSSELRKDPEVVRAAAAQVRLSGSSSSSSSSSSSEKLNKPVLRRASPLTN